MCMYTKERKRCFRNTLPIFLKYRPAELDNVISDNLNFCDTQCSSMTFSLRLESNSDNECTYMCLHRNQFDLRVGEYFTFANNRIKRAALLEK
jgi:hypothetical protein